MSIQIQLKAALGTFHLDIDTNWPGQGVTSLYGPSGSGKTSVIRAIAGLDRHPDASIRFGDQTWQKDATFVPAHKRRVGLVFQDTALFTHLNVKGNLSFAARRSGAENSNLLDRAIEFLELGQLLNQDCYSLSGGEKQRVAIARALASNPQLLMLDEPLSAVDQAHRQEILPYLESLHGELKIPVIHVSHSTREVAQLADHLVLMADGKVTEQGPAGQLLTRLDLPLAKEDGALSVIEAEVRSHDSHYHLTTLAFSGGDLIVPRLDVSPQQRVRLQVAARDVSVTVSAPQQSSILNVLPAVVLEVETNPKDSLALVSLSVGEAILLARLTRKSVDMLTLKQGVKVYAQIKSIALVN